MTTQPTDTKAAMVERAMSRPLGDRLDDAIANIQRWPRAWTAHDALDLLRDCRESIIPEKGEAASFDVKCLPDGIRPLIRVTLNARQLHQAWQLANPDAGDEDQEETEIAIRWWPGGMDTDGDKAEPGYYAHLDEYPEEGALFLDPERPIDPPPAASPVAAPHQTAGDEPLTIKTAPLGTVAKSIYGGRWTKVARGWKWTDGSTFPTPGGDWDGQLLPPQTAGDAVESHALTSTGVVAHKAANVSDNGAGDAREKMLREGVGQAAMSAEEAHRAFAGTVAASAPSECGNTRELAELLEYAKRAPRVSAEEVLEIAHMPAHELRRRTICNRDWHRLFAQSLDGFPELDKFTATPDGCWGPHEIRRVVSGLLAERAALPAPPPWSGNPRHYAPVASPAGVPRTPHWPILLAILRPAIATGQQAVIHHARRLAEVLEGDERATLVDLLTRGPQTFVRVVPASQGVEMLTDEADAKRYRWLRDEGAGVLQVYRGTEEHSLLPDEFDAAVDAAIASQEAAAQTKGRLAS